ncbi:MAG TPA: hypothetical protein VEH62_09475 [Gemmatimonadales bacterium]|nr:hypothetical protein [Gemmatimonadales bacterium]
MGCLRKALAGVGCLVVLVAIAAGYLYREHLAALWRRVRGTPAPPPVVYVAPAPGAARDAEATLAQLARPVTGGSAYVDLTASELAALIQRQLDGTARGVVDSVAVALGDQRIAVRGSLDMSVLPHRLLGPLSEGLGSREPVVAGGVISARRDGRVVWTIDQLRIRELDFPRQVIPSILRAMTVTGAEGASVPIPLPAGVGDVRVSPKGVRVYRASSK